MRILNSDRQPNADPFASSSDISGFLFGKEDLPDKYNKKIGGPEQPDYASDPFIVNQTASPLQDDVKHESTAFISAMEQAVGDNSADEETAWNHEALRALFSRFDNEDMLMDEYNRTVKDSTLFEGRDYSSLSDAEKAEARSVAEREFFAREYGKYLKENGAPLGLLTEQQENSIKEPEASLQGTSEKPRSVKLEALAFFDELKMVIQEGVADEDTERDYATIRRWLSRFDNEMDQNNEYERSVRYLPRFGGRLFSSLSGDEKNDARATVEREFFARSYEEFRKESGKPAEKDKPPAAGKEKDARKLPSDALGIGNDLAKLFANCTKWIMSVLRKALYAPLPDDVSRVFGKIGSPEAIRMRDDGASPSP